jgi:CRP-like cAMP-binding protein
MLAPITGSVVRQEFPQTDQPCHQNYDGRKLRQAQKEMSILQALRRCPMRTGGLLESLGLSAMSLNRALNRLKADGLIGQERRHPRRWFLAAVGQGDRRGSVD